MQRVTMAPASSFVQVIALFKENNPELAMMLELNEADFAAASADPAKGISWINGVLASRRIPLRSFAENDKRWKYLDDQVSP